MVYILFIKCVTFFSQYFKKIILINMSKRLYISFMGYDDNFTTVLKKNLIKHFNYKNHEVVDLPIINDENSIYFVVKFWKRILFYNIKAVPKSLGFDDDNIHFTQEAHESLLPLIQKVKSTKSNTFIFQCIDAYCNLNLMVYKGTLKKTFLYFDHIVFNSIFHSMMFFDWKFYINKYPDLQHFKTEDEALDHYKKYGIHENRQIFEKSHSVIYHEYDVNLKPTYKITNEVIYLGSLEKTSLSEEDFEKYNIILGDINMTDSCIHIDFLNSDHMYYSVHTSTKLSTALYFNCIFVCNRIPVYVELLGENYEFYINDDKSNLESIINNTKEILLDKKKYNNYLNSVSHVKQMLSPENIGKEHKILFNKFN